MDNNLIYEGALRKATKKIEELFQEISALKKQDPIAIIGVACRFPGGSNTPEGFWRLLENAVDAIGEIPGDRWEIERYYHPDPEVPGKMYTKYGGFLDDVDKFSPAFFEISPKEAEVLDPQQRLLLEVSWEALENSGLNSHALKGSQTGIFVGIGNCDYQTLLMKRPLEECTPYFGTGVMLNTACGRLSYFYDFRGPCMPTDTACSSSLVAIHLAVQSLVTRETDLALACGVSLLLTPEPLIFLSSLGALSLDGRCKSFAAAANGFGKGEGCGVVVLKRLSDALQDGDTILAVITGSAIGHDGRSNGLTAPNGIAQENVLRKALEKAGSMPDDIDYVETHGTGTNLGDPIEAQALGNVFNSRKEPLLIGAVKTNLAHMEPAAGIASLIKVILALQHKTIPPSLHFEKPNPYIPWEELPLKMVTELTPWKKRADKPRRAGVSSFGIGGTLAHIIVEEAPEVEHKPNEVERPFHILAFSAKGAKELADLAELYRHYILQSNDDIANICHTALISRTFFEIRAAFVASSKEDFVKQLSCYVQEKREQDTFMVSDPEIVFMFTGQGSQYRGMGQALYEYSPIFKAELERCDTLFSNYLDKSLIELLYAEDAEAGALNQAVYTQPAIFAIEYALAQLWQSWGIQPSMILGHSIGEYAAACIAGIFSLEDAVKLVAIRGKLMHSVAEKGMMVGVLASEERLRSFLNDYCNTVSIAAVNTRENVTISGSKESIEAVLQKLKQARIFVERLNISHAFHSVLMTPHVERFKQEMKGIRFKTPEIPFMSTMTGKNGEDICTIEYWSNHIQRTVRFCDAMETAEEEGYRIFLEIGGTATLAGLAGQCICDKKSVFVPSLRPGNNACWQMLSSLAELYRHGYPVDWKKFEAPYHRKKVVLPNYPFQKERFWIRADKKDYGKMLYFVDWEEKEREHASDIERKEKNYIIFSDGKGVGDAIATLVTQTGGSCYKVIKSTTGPPFQRVTNSPKTYSLNPESEEGVRTLFKELRLHIYTSNTIIYLWGIDNFDSENLTSRQLIKDQTETCSTLLAIVQALFELERTTSENAKLWIITQNSQHIDSIAHDISVSQTTLWGLGKAVEVEMPELWGGMIDIDDTISHNGGNILLHTIDSEQESQLCLREHGRRFVSRLSSGAERIQSEKYEIRPDGTYFITGGLGALGVFFAKWIVKKGARHLVLTGRKEPKPEAQKVIADLKKQGVEIMVMPGDVSCEDNVNEIVKKITRSMPQLRGIIHAAGILRDEMLTEQNWEMFRAVFAPKVMGAWNLHKAARDIPLDFFVMFSSLASVFGGVGQSNYAAANMFMNGLAWYRKLKGLPATSICWGPWAEIGMTASYRDGELINTLSNIGIYAMSPKDGLAIFERVLASNCIQPCVVDVDWALYRNYIPLRQKTGLWSKFVKELKSLEQDDIVTQLEAALPVERFDMFIPYLQRITSPIMGFDTPEKILTHKPLMEQGFDSLMSVQLRNRLAKIFGVELSATLLFAYPTIEKITHHLLEDVLLFETQKSETSRQEIHQEKISGLLDKIDSLLDVGRGA